MLVEKIKHYPPLPRLSLFFFALLLIWLPLAIPIYLLLNDSNPNLTTIITMGLLFIEFLFLVKLWGKRVYGKPNIFTYYGLIFKRKNFHYLLKGLAIGFSLTWLLFIIEAALGWLKFEGFSANPLGLLLEGLVSAIAIALGEELLFRGWLLTELERDYPLNRASWFSALAFATLHFLKPIGEVIRTIVTFPALILLGLTLAWAKRSHDNLLGICIGLHGGLVWGYYVLSVGEAIAYTDKVPSWITGIDRNPIAGLMGLIFLSLLGFWMRKKVD